MGHRTGITFTPRKSEFTPRTYYRDTSEIFLNDFRGTMPMEILRKLFPSDDGKIEIAFMQECVMIRPRKLSSVKVNDIPLQNDHVFVFNVGERYILSLEGEEFDVKIFVFEN